MSGNAARMEPRASEATTPLMQQYREIKARHPDAILFFRMGDFYEMFFDDARLGARLLNIALTSRGDGVPLAGVPVKAATDYLRQLVASGHRVAICEQVEDPRLARGIVRREVVETVTPGALLADGWIPGARNNWMVAVGGRTDGRNGPHAGRRTDPEAASTREAVVRGAIGLAAIDLSTGEFVLEVLDERGLDEALSRLNPAEVVLPVADGADRFSANPSDRLLITRRDPWEFDLSLAGEELARRFGLASLDGLGLGADDAPAVGAAGALLRYLADLQPAGLAHLARPTVRRSDAHLWLDEMTRRNLELTEPLSAGARNSTLLEAIDGTVTPMGARLLRAWLLSPLRATEAIARRLDAVEVFVGEGTGRARLREALDGVRDLERLAGRAAAGRATPRELGALRDSFGRLPGLCSALAGLARRARSAALETIARDFDPLADLTAELSAALEERPPALLADGDVIRRGYDAELDELRALRDGGRQYIATLQQRERERTGIGSLKVGFNKVFGYYLEVTNAHAARVPADYERRQTLAGAERYVTPELKDYEARVLGAEERIGAREAELFGALRGSVGNAIGRIQATSRAVAALDVWSALGELAAAHEYVRPEVDDGFDLSLAGSRHAVIERLLPRGTFIPNDVRFSEAERVLLVTGPNMAGKSTILRQIGLCVVLAQMGSFVPAASARIGVVDRLFTRVGASDNLARGQSTFMVEMSETSAILHNATARSLVLLDEIGRGTSTYDGVAIAWAVTEHLHDRIGCKTMFATHYHELMQLPERLAHARNVNVAVREAGGTVVFLHRLEPGGTDRSYGIHVAQLAGLPAAVVRRANEMLGTLEGGHRVVPGAPPVPNDPGQFALFGADPERGPNAAVEPHPVVEEIRALDLDALTPLEALNRLADLQRRAGGA
ncbi:MAG TPA: DNA mismatch repair protein MutS [Gemmatimonadales bacterium]|nr:DNA mismatch repair protein MutS [Gemmatimonadales bacterium]